MLLVQKVFERRKNMEQLWSKWNGERIIRPREDEIRFALRRERERGHEMKVCIGTDSQVKGRITDFATVIVFTRKGKGGFMYIRNDSTDRKMSIRERMLLEVAKSIDVAFVFCRLFTLYGV